MFAELLQQDGDPGTVQRRAAEAVPGLVAGSRLKPLPADPGDVSPDSAVLGIAVWSTYDLALLDEINAGLSRRSSGAMPDVFVFDLSDVATPEEGLAKFPGGSHTELLVSPLVEVRQGGQVASTAAGAAKVREALCEFGVLSSPADTHRPAA